MVKLMRINFFCISFTFLISSCLSFDRSNEYDWADNNLRVITYNIAKPEIKVNNQIVIDEFTLIFSGLSEGIIFIQKEASGRIVITSNITKGMVSINDEVCPILPSKINEYYFIFYPSSRRATIEGNTTTFTNIYGQNYQIIEDGNTTTEIDYMGNWLKEVIEGNEITWSTSDGFWRRTVVEGNTTIQTSSDGNGYVAVVEGNTKTVTYQNEDWLIEVIEENAVTRKWSNGSWDRTTVEENITIYEDSRGNWSKTVIDGNSKIVTNSSGFWGRTIVDRQDNIIRIHSEEKR